MKNITYNGPGHLLRFPKSGRELARGETAEVANAEAEYAQAAPNIDVTVEDDADSGDALGTDQPSEADTGEGHQPTDPDQEP